MADSAFRDLVVIVGANRWDGVRMADRQLADALADEMPVLYVDPPISFMTRRRQPQLQSKGSRLRILRPGLAHLAPDALPGLTRPGISEANSWLLAAQIRRAVHALGGSLHALIDTRVLSPVIGRCGEDVSVYWAQDDFVGLAPLLGSNPKRLRRGEQIMTSRADLVIAANTQVRETVRADGKSAELIPFGCDYEVFATTEHIAPAADITLPQPYAVFMGHIGDRIDAEVLAAVIEQGTNVLAVGPRHGHATMSQYGAMLDRPNVQWVGAKDFDELPAYLAGASVGLLPYTRSRFNIGSFPLKTLEYLAAGLPVVATDLPAIRWLDCEDIAVSNDPTEFARHVDWLVKQGRDRTGDDRRRQFAAEHTWAKRASAFAGVIRSRQSREHSFSH
jgi:glycosyltransferase involved in cell wall biosynthesis